MDKESGTHLQTGQGNTCCCICTKAAQGGRLQRLGEDLEDARRELGPLLAEERDEGGGLEGGSPCCQGCLETLRSLARGARMAREATDILKTKLKEGRGGWKTREDPPVKPPEGAEKTEATASAPTQEQSSLTATAKGSSNRCELCGRSFAQRRYLRDHQRRIHGGGGHLSYRTEELERPLAAEGRTPGDGGGQQVQTEGEKVRIIEYGNLIFMVLRPLHPLRPL